MARVLISYASPDRGFARQLERKLWWAGHDTWIDYKNRRPGTLSGIIGSELGNADCTIFCHSNRTPGSWVEAELRVATELEHMFGKQVIHVRIEHTRALNDIKMIDFFPARKRRAALRDLLHSLPRVPLHARPYVLLWAAILILIGPTLVGLAELVEYARTRGRGPSVGDVPHQEEQSHGKDPLASRIPVSWKASTESKSNPLEGAFDGNPETAWCTASNEGKGARVDMRVPDGWIPEEVRVRGGWDIFSKKAQMNMWDNTQIAQTVEVAWNEQRATLAFSRADRGVVRTARVDPSTRDITVTVVDVIQGPIRTVCMPEIEVLGRPR